MGAALRACQTVSEGLEIGAQSFRGPRELAASLVRTSTCGVELRLRSRAGLALHAVPDLLHHRPQVGHVEGAHRIGVEVERRLLPALERCGRALGDHERRAGRLAADERARRLARRRARDVDRRILGQLLEERAAELAPVLVDHYQRGTRGAARVAAVQVGERQPCHRDHHHRRDGEEHETDAIAGEESQVLPQRCRQRAQHHRRGATPLMPPPLHRRGARVR